MTRRKTAVAALILLIASGFYRYTQSVPVIRPTVTAPTVQTDQAVELPWPTYGQGALYASGYGNLDSHGQQKPAPMASVTKVITALAVLKKKPLADGQAGPLLTISSDDVAIYNNYLKQNGSVLKVTEGEKISEYQALQALLIPSANNIADTLVRWAFGSMENYLTYANKMVSDLSLKQTKVADASGFSALSTSTPQDLVKLGQEAINNSVVLGIVTQQSVDLPEAGETKNVNWLLGSDGVFGIKTGNTDEAGGCFLFAAKRTIKNQTVTLIGALMQAPDLDSAIKDSQKIILASDDGFQLVKLIGAGQVVGYHKTPWGSSSDDIAQTDLFSLAWRGTSPQPVAKLGDVNTPANANTKVGSVSSVTDQKSSVPVVLKSGLRNPPIWWRLLR